MIIITKDSMGWWQKNILNSMALMDLNFVLLSTSQHLHQEHSFIHTFQDRSLPIRTRPYIHDKAFLPRRSKSALHPIKRGSSVSGPQL